MRNLLRTNLLRVTSAAVSLTLAATAIAACDSDPEIATDSLPGSTNGTSGGGPNGTGPNGGGPSTGSGGASGPDGGGSPDVDVPLPYVHFDVNHVLSTGQSNAVANDAKPVLSTTQPYGNLMFDVGVMTSIGCDGNGCTTYQKPNAFVPLVEGDTFFYPIETMSAGLANEIGKLVSVGESGPLAGRSVANHDVLVSLHGRSGNSYWCLRKGGCPWWPEKNYVRPFDDAMKQVEDAKALATASGKTYAVRAITAIHGEHDHYAYSSNDSAFPLDGTDGSIDTVKDYADGLIEWQRDYEASVKEITGQAVGTPLFVQQYSHWNDVPTTKIAYMQLDAHVRAPGKVVVVGPTYALPYTNACLHFTNHGERHLGEYFAKAYSRVVLEGKRWEPLRPIAVTRVGNVITAKFHVPVPPLVLDTERVSDPGNYGFEFVDGTASPPAIASVALSGPDTVTITLGAAPSGPARLRYAYTFTGCAGSGSLARGNLRDSDATPSQHGYELFNWSVHFDRAIE